MKKLVLSALLCGSLVPMGTGCIFVSDDDPDDPPIVELSAQLDIAWDLVGGPNNDPVDCPPDAITARVVVQPVGAGAATEYDFDCRALSGVTDFHAIGSYDISIEILDAADFLIAASEIVTVDLIDSDDGAVVVVEALTFSVDHGSFGLTWTLVDAATNEAVTCADVAPLGVDGVAVTSTLQDGTGTLFDDPFLCEDAAGQTRALPVGNYVVVTSLIDAGGASIADSMPRETSIDFGNHFNDLGNFEFAFEF